MTTTNENSALVTIIIPAYNTEHYIHRAIESSIRQTYKNIEIIIIDDGSTDGTLRVARSYEPQDDRIRVIHQENKGVSSARNHGIREAKGEYITFLDSDDWFEDDAVEVLVEAQEKYPDAIISADRYCLSINFDKKIFIRTEPEKKYNEQFLTIEEAIMSIDKIRFRSTSAKIYRLEHIKSNSTFFREDIGYGEDMLFNLLYTCELKKLYYMPRSIINIVLRPGSALRTKFSDKKIFVDGKINDWIQVMIDYPNNTPEMNKVLKFLHTTTFIGELSGALSCNADYSSINKVKEKVKLYFYDNMPFYDKNVGRLKKIYHCCLLYLPICISKLICRLRIFAGNISSKLRSNDNGEIINFW